MSGGSFNYAFHHVYDFCDELENRLEERQPGAKNSWGEEIEPLKPEVAERLREIMAQGRALAPLMKEVEWLFSCDTSEETFLARVSPERDGGGE